MDIRKMKDFNRFRLLNTFEKTEKDLLRFKVFCLSKFNWSPILYIYVDSKSIILILNLHRYLNFLKQIIIHHIQLNHYRHLHMLRNLELYLLHPKQMMNSITMY
jgi:hypothetical protein